MTRPLKPRASAALLIAPLAISDLTAPAQIGLEARPFREFLVREGVPHARIGQRVIARREDVLAAIDRLAEREQTATEESSGPEEEEGEDGVEGVLRLVGRTRRTP